MAANDSEKRGGKHWRTATRRGPRFSIPNFNFFYFSLLVRTNRTTLIASGTHLDPHLDWYIQHLGKIEFHDHDQVNILVPTTM